MLSLNPLFIRSQIQMISSVTVRRSSLQSQSLIHQVSDSDHIKSCYMGVRVERSQSLIHQVSDSDDDSESDYVNGIQSQSLIHQVSDSDNLREYGKK